VHAAGGDFAIVASSEQCGLVVAGDGDLAAQDQDPGVEVVAVIRRNLVRLPAAIHDTESVGTQVRRELGLVHRPFSLLGPRPVHCKGHNVN